MLNVNNNEKRTGTHKTKRETQSGEGIKGKGKSKQAGTESTQANTINEYSYYIEDVITI